MRIGNPYFLRHFSGRLVGGGGAEPDKSLHTPTYRGICDPARPPLTPIVRCSIIAA